MNVPAKLGGFAMVLVVAFGAGVGIGRAVGPLDDDGGGAGHRGSHNASQPRSVSRNTDAAH